MGFKEDTCGDEHWVLYAINESLNSTSETSDVLYSGLLNIIIIIIIIKTNDKGKKKKQQH